MKTNYKKEVLHTPCPKCGNETTIVELAQTFDELLVRMLHCHAILEEATRDKYNRRKVAVKCGHKWLEVYPSTKFNTDKTINY
jgi:ribosomal protein S27E